LQVSTSQLSSNLDSVYYLKDSLISIRSTQGWAVTTVHRRRLPIDKKSVMADEKVSVDMEKGSPLPAQTVEQAAAETILKHSVDADEALKALEGHDVTSVVLDEETNRRLLRKIDLNIMPASEAPAPC
jgi:2-polyprenyl-6-methoxyphenol hydroxylase-like FAD-dependent oxidoreductase